MRQGAAPRATFPSGFRYSDFPTLPSAGHLVCAFSRRSRLRTSSNALVNVHTMLNQSTVARASGRCSPVPLRNAAHDFNNIARIPPCAPRKALNALSVYLPRPWTAKITGSCSRCISRADADTGCNTPIELWMGHHRALPSVHSLPQWDI